MVGLNKHTKKENRSCSLITSSVRAELFQLTYALMLRHKHNVTALTYVM